MDKETVMGSALGPMMDEDAGAVGPADATTASKMTAIVQRRYGRPDVLESTAVDKPVVGDDDVPRARARLPCWPKRLRSSSLGAELGRTTLSWCIHLSRCPLSRCSARR